jgi:hypothetical protein
MTNITQTTRVEKKTGVKNFWKKVFVPYLFEIFET